MFPDDKDICDILRSSFDIGVKLSRLLAIAKREAIDVYERKEREKEEQEEKQRRKEMKE